MSTSLVLLLVIVVTIFIFWIFEPDNLEKTLLEVLSSNQWYSYQDLFDEFNAFRSINIDNDRMDHLLENLIDKGIVETRKKHGHFQNEYRLKQI